MSSVLITIRGNSGSGKSSVAKELQRRLGSNTLLISQDMVRREMLLAKDGKGNVSLPLLTTLLKYGHEHCNYVILEGIFKAEWYIPLFKLASETFGDNICSYYYDIPFDETLRRHETRGKKEEFGEKDMRRWWNEKDYIGVIPEKLFHEDISLQDAVDMICNDITGEKGVTI